MYFLRKDFGGDQQIKTELDMNVNLSLRGRLLPLILFMWTSQVVFGGDILNATVKIVGTGGNQGTGFIFSITKEDLFIVTAAHVVGSDKEVEVFFFRKQDGAGTGTTGGVVEMTTGEVKDIALLKVGRDVAPSTVEKVRAGFSIGLRKGDLLTIVGQPLNSERGWVVDPTAEVTDDASDVVDFSSSRVGPGFSGGPVLDKDGLVVGMIGSDSVNSKDDTGRAVPIETVTDFVERSRELRPQTNLQLNGALKLLFGLTGVVDYPKARTLFNTAANSGDELSMAWKSFLEATGSCGFRTSRSEGSAELARLLPQVKALSRQRVGAAAFLQGQALYFGWGITRNLSAANEEMREALDLGFEPARAVLADFYFRGVGQAADRREAINILEKDKITLLPAGMVRLAVIYLSDEESRAARPSRKLLEDAAEFGEPSAMLRLGDLYLYGDGVDQNVGSAREWYARAAQAGEPFAHVAQAGAELWDDNPEAAADLAKNAVRDSSSPDAKWMLALLTANGLISGGADDAATMKLLTEATEEGSELALVQLATCYLEGFATEQNFEKGERLLREALDRKLIKAIAVDGIRHFNALGTARDIEKAYHAFLKAANYNDSNGLVGLGLLYKLGHVPDEPPDPDKALELFLRAGRKGSGSGYRLAGSMHVPGPEDDGEPEKAEKYFMKALKFGDKGALAALVDLYMNNRDFAEQSSGINKVRDILERQEENRSPDAKALLGFLDLVFEQNVRAAVERIRTAAGMGSALAMNMMADLYVRGGYGVLRDIREAERWAKSGVAKGDVSSVAQLGYIYWEQGRFEDARKLWRRAAEQEQPYALYTLALLYLYGEGGVRPDNKRGQELLKAASMQGAGAARQLLQLIRQYGGLPSPMPRIAPPGPR